MIRSYALPAFIALLSACAPKSPAQPASTEGAAPAATTPAAPPAKATAQPMRIEFAGEVDPVAAPIGSLKRGINLGNGFDAPQIGAWGVILEEKHFEMAAAAGLDHVRLPVRFSAHAQTEAPYTIDEEFFQKVDWAIENALSRKLSIIVDLHHYEELMKEPEAHFERTLGLWEQISARYKDQPPEVLFELVNEPCNQLTPTKYNKLLAQLIPVVRKDNPERTLIVNSFFWSAPNYLEALELPEDPNIVGSFHMYQPILFTHQGASWMEPEFQSTNIVFPGPGDHPANVTPAAEQVQWTRQWLESYNTQPAGQNPSGPAAVATEFDNATRWVKKTGRRAYLGEFGAIDFADSISRENFIRLTRLEAERRGFAWAVWDDGGHNKAMNIKTGKWVSPVAKGLFTAQPGEALPEGISVE